MEALDREKNVVGLYISGHPLDDYKRELSFSNISLVDFEAQLPNLINREVVLGGIITATMHRTTKDNKGWGAFTLLDFSGSYEFRVWSEEYLKYKHFMVENTFCANEGAYQAGLETWGCQNAIYQF